MGRITRYYLEMLSPEALNAEDDAKQLTVSEARVKQFPMNRFLYQFIGGDWGWLDKLSWTDGQWRQWVERDNLRTWIAFDEGAIAGYFELEQGEDGNTEIAYFGLVPDYIGKGHGAYLLSQALKSAWDWPGTQRVWLHTCTLDHPHALGNYLARGMTMFREEVVDNPCD